jgi:c-di-AMP phosphodiesterase-like protein
MQIDSELVKHHIEESSLVIIMAHRNMDLDALGSSLGLYYLCKTIGREACLLIDDSTYEDGVARSLKGLDREKINVKIKKWADLEDTIDDKTLLIIVDTNVAGLVQNGKALTITNKIIIDHHIQNDNKCIKCIYEYISEEPSSTVEIVIQIMKHLNIYIHPYIATIMLGGIFVDTTGFYRKTTYKTHEAAAYLYECGATLNDLHYLLKENINKYNDMQQIIKESKIINKNFIIAVGHVDNVYHKEDLAKISNTMLLFNNIEASFAIGKVNAETIGISARSLGNIDVEKIMKKLGGGGHLTDAATQLNSDNLQESYKKLESIINKLEGGCK